MNKDLKSRVFDLPNDVVRHLNHYLSQENSDSNGAKRARNLVKTKKVNYGQLKRILYDMKKFDNTDLKYNLCGGKPMEDWGWKSLGEDRGMIDKNKQSTQTANNITGLGKNPYKKKHKKNATFTSPTNVFKSSKGTSSLVSMIPSTKLFEEINRIKTLMN